MCGVSPSTLRAWERRYNVVEPVRTEGGYRVYDDAALRRLTRMSSLIASGWPPRHAAAYVMNEDGDGSGALPIGGPADEEIPDPVPPTMKEERQQIEVLLQAATDLDAPHLADELDFAFSIHSFDDLVNQWLGPVLKATARAYESGRLSDAGEHFLTAGIERRMTACFKEPVHHAGTGSPRVVLGVAGDSAHPIGAIAFAASLRRHGCDVTYLGTDVAPQAWIEAIDARGADCVGVSIPRPEDAAAAARIVTELTRSRPQCTVYYGGLGSDQIKFTDAVLLTGKVSACTDRIIKDHRKGLARAS